MNPMGLMEMAQISEQEHMREALRRRALREARKEAGVTWIQVIRARLFRIRGRDSVAASAPAPVSAASAAASSAPVVVAPTTAAPVAAAPSFVSAQPPAARPVRATVTLRVVRAAEPDCVGADC